MFALLMAALAAVGTTLGLTHAGVLSAGALAAKLNETKFGYKLGESRFSPQRAHVISTKAPTELGRKLAELMPYVKQNRKGMVYTLTKSEREFLESLAEPAIDAALALEWLEVNNAPAEMVKKARATLKSQIRPILRYLNEFPATRTTVIKKRRVA